MADSLSQKSSKSGDKSKHCLTLNRTTSETLRISEPEKNINHPSSLSSTSGANIRKKAPSFQITSVTVGSRISNDGGDDSADDLDESHTEDMSDVNDRTTDLENETPSYSEDTFSREDLFFSSALTTAAPVIPTSSQYGLAIVSEGSGGTSLNNVGANIVGDFVSVADNVMLNLSVKHAEERDPHHPLVRNERFKVVKIESTEPFKRGRWTCMDYLDHTMVQPVSGHEELVGASGEAYHEGVVLPMSSDVFHPHAQSQIFTVHPLQQGVGNTVAGQSLPAGIVPHAAQPAPQYYSPPSHPVTILPTDNGPTPSQVQQQHPGSGGSVSTQTQTGHNASVSPPSSNGPGAHMIQSPIMNNMQNATSSQPILQQQSQTGLRSVGSSGNLQQHAASSINQAPSVQQQQQYAPQSGVQMQHQSVMQQQSNANMQQMQQIQQQQQQQYIQQQQPQQQYIQPQKPATTQLPPGFIHQNMNSVQQQQQGNNYPPQQQQQQPQQAMSQPAGFVSSNMMQQTMNQPQHQQQMSSASQAQSYVQQPQQPVYSQPQAMSQPAGFISQTVQQPQQQVMSNFVPSSNQQLPPQQTVNYMPVTNTVQQQQQQLPSSVPQPVSQPSLVNHTPAVMPNTVHVSAGQNYMPTQSSIPSMPQQHQLPVQPQNSMPSMQQQPVQVQNSMPQQSMQVQNSMAQQHQQSGQTQSSIQSMQQHQQPVQIQNSMPQQHQQPVQTQNSMPQQHQQPMQTQTSMPQQHQQPVQSQTSMSSMPQQHQQPVQTQTSMSSMLQQHQQPVQTQNSMPQQHQQPVQTQNSMPQQHQQPVQTQNSMPQQHQQPVQTQNSMPQQHQQPVQTQNSMPQQHQQPVQTQNSMPQQHQQPVQTQNSMPQQHQQPVQTQSTMPQQHTVQMVNHQPGQSYSHHPVTPLVSNSSSQTVTAQSYSHPLNLNVPQPVPARTAPAPLVITNGSPMSTPHMEPASHQELLNAGVLEPRLLESLADVATSMGTKASEEQPAAGEDAESSSGTSAVAIDNKIEQAMDLVKSHLMFAVREEVEVLKEKIVELTGRINQLEYENTVLKAHASQETLQQLVVPLPQQQQLPQQPVPPQQQAPAPQAAPAPATMMGGGGGKAQQAPTSVS